MDARCFNEAIAKGATADSGAIGRGVAKAVSGYPSAGQRGAAGAGGAKITDYRLKKIMREQKVAREMAKNAAANFSQGGKKYFSQSTFIFSKELAVCGDARAPMHPQFDLLPVELRHNSSALHLSWMIGPRRARIDACSAWKSYQEGIWHWRGILGETQVRAGLVQKVHP
jgi:hypothetical protein